MSRVVSCAPHARCKQRASEPVQRSRAFLVPFGLLDLLAFPASAGVLGVHRRSRRFRRSQMSSLVSVPFTVRQILRMFKFCNSTGNNPCGSP